MNETLLVSRASGADGEKGNSQSASFYDPISADGHYSVFGSAATNLHPDATNGFYQVFLRDQQTQETIFISRADGSDGASGNSHSHEPSISSDGRYVVFVSFATNLDPDDQDGTQDVYVRDLQTHETILASRSDGADGGKGNGTSHNPSISVDGRYVAFASQATNLHPDDLDATEDIYVRDLVAQETILVSRAGGVSGVKGNAFSGGPLISDDGRYIVFYSEASNLHPDDPDGGSFENRDVFVRDIQEHETVLISRAGGMDGIGASGASFDPSISADGRYVAFSSYATNLHPEDPDDVGDVFVRDLQTHEIILASRADGVDGEKGFSASFGTSISGDGRFVAFLSQSSNLQSDDPDETDDLFVRDLQTNRTILASRASGLDGAKANDRVGDSSISEDGRYVIFYTQATNLHPDDADSIWDVFQRDALGPPLEAELIFDPSSLDFGDVEVGTTSLPRTATLRNIGGSDVTGLAVNATDSSFGIDASACGSTLPSGGSCDVAVIFSPPGLGFFEATVVVLNDQDTSADLDLAGNGVGSPGAALSFDEGVLAFGDVEVGGNASEVVVLQNTGAGGASGLNFSLPGNSFAADASSCGDALGSGESCVVVVSFTPLVEGPTSTELHVGSIEGAAASVSLVGTGVRVSPQLAFSPGAFDFGEVAVGSSSSSQTALLQNTGNGDATALAFTTSGDGFEADSSACGNTLAAGASCPIQINFTPAAPGAVGALLRVESSEGAMATLGNEWPDKYLYFTSHGLKSILRMDPGDIGSGRSLFTSENDNAHSMMNGLVVDTPNCAYYWVPEENQIWRTSINGTDESVLSSTASSNLRDLAIDPLTSTLYFNRGGSIYRGAIGSAGLTDILHVVTTPGESELIQNIVIDLAGQRLYWAEFATGIWSSGLDGSNVEHIAAASGLPPKGLALDSQGGKVYWGDSEQAADGNVRIHRANLDGSGYEVFLVFSDEGASEDDGVEDIVVRSAIGKIFWSMEDAKGFFRANLDASEVEVIDDDSPTISSLTFAPGGIDTLCGQPAADICPTGAECDAVETIYWIGGNSSGGELWRARADGTRREAIYGWIAQGGPVQPLGLAVSRELGKVYWTQTPSRIYRADLDGSSVELVLQLPFSPGAYPYGIAFDVGAGKIFITQRARDGFAGGDPTKATLWRANLDGSDLEVRTVLDAAPPEAGGFHGGMGGPQLDGQARIGYVSADDTVYRFALDDDEAPEVIVPSLPEDLYPEGGGWQRDGSAHALQIDLLHGKLYWRQFFFNATTSTGRTYRVNLDGTQIEAMPWAMAATEYVGRTGLALDPHGGRMYGVNIFGDAVSRWEIDSGVHLALVHSELEATPIGGISLLPAKSGDTWATLSLTGVGVGPGLAIAPQILDFGAAPVGDSTGPESVTLVSTGNASVEVTSIASAAVPFERSGGDCPATPFDLAPNESCTLDYSFTPPSVSAFEQVLDVYSTAGPRTFTLIGEGVPPPPRIDVDPPSFEFSVLAGDTASETLAIANLGAESLAWTIQTAESTPKVDDSRAHFPEVLRDVDHKRDPGVSAGSRPQQWNGAEGWIGTVSGITLRGSVPAYSTTFAPAIGYVTLNAAAPDDLTVVTDAQPSDFFAATFINNNVNTQYLLASGGSLPADTFGTIDTATGEFTNLGTVTGSPTGVWTSMKWDATTATVYAVKHGTDSQLFAIDPATLEATLVGSVGGSGVNPDAVVIAIAVSPQGLMYGIDIVDDVLLALDKETGEAAVISELGLDANFAQDMDFDQSTGILYWAGYHRLGDSYISQVLTIDTGTGGVTPIGDVAGDVELASFSIAVARSSCFDPSSISWLSAAPASGETLGGGTSNIQISVDASNLEPGTHGALLCVASNDPDRPMVEVPVDVSVMLPIPALAFDPASLDFGEVAVGETSAPLATTLTNDGNADATGLAFSLPDGAFVADTSACGDTLAADASCVVSVTFAPDAAAPATATLHVESEGGAVADLDLAGTGFIAQEPDVGVAIEATRDYLRPGQMADYLVTLGNVGPGTASDAHVASVLSPELDLDFASWLCVGPASSGCTPAGQGDLADTGLTVPEGGSVTYLLSAPVRWDAQGPAETAASAGHAGDPNPANDAALAITPIALYRDGFEVYGGIAMMPLLPLVNTFGVTDVLTVDWLAAADEVQVETVLAAARAQTGATPANPAFRLERITAGALGWARLVARDTQGTEYASHWLPVTYGTQATLVLADASQTDAATGESRLHRTLLLFTADGELQLPLVDAPDAYRLWSTMPASITPLGNSN